MESVATFLLMVLVAATLSSAIPKPDDHKRVIDKELSDEKHYAEEEHNPEYDHEAFLGKETAKTFDQLEPEESIKRLGIIYDKIDKDGDGFVTEEELMNWVKHVQNRYIVTDTEKQWKDHEVEGDKLAWASYKTRTYGQHEEDVADDGDGEGGYDYKNMITRDERRWKKADLDGDGALTKDEFASFLHPEDVEHMRDTVVEETLEDIDKDKDGSISLEEYIDDIHDDDDDDEDSEEDEDEDREEFKNHLDKNGDGKLDREDIKAWIIPDDYDHVNEETKHLLRESDVNEDGKLSKEEVLDKYDLFVGSQATDFGEALARHDEF